PHHTPPLAPYTTLFRSRESRRIGRRNLFGHHSSQFEFRSRRRAAERRQCSSRSVLRRASGFHGQSSLVHVPSGGCTPGVAAAAGDRKSTRLNSSHEWIS